MASPAATGAAALLVSAAKQSNVQKQPAQLRQAMISSARLLDTSRYQVFEQGNGLINVGAAWDLLKTNIKTVDISSSVPVNTVISQFLASDAATETIPIKIYANARGAPTPALNALASVMLFATLVAIAAAYLLIRVTRPARVERESGLGDFARLQV